MCWQAGAPCVTVTVPPSFLFRLREVDVRLSCRVLCRLRGTKEIELLTATRNKSASIKNWFDTVVEETPLLESHHDVLNVSDSLDALHVVVVGAPEERLVLVRKL